MKKLLALLLCVTMLLATVSLLAGCNGEKKDTGTYTYNDYMADSPNTWSPHEWETNEDSIILSYITTALYEFKLNETKDGYDIIPEAAAAMPVDVTADYAGNEKYNVPAGATSGYAFKIALNEDLTWEDGTKIDADTYVYSMEKMLSSSMKNYRASGYYAGTMTIANAYNFYMQDNIGAHTYKSLEAAGYANIAEAEAAGITEFFVDMDGLWGMTCGWQATTDDTMYVDAAVPEGEAEHEVSGKYLYDNYLAAGMPYESYQGTYIGIIDSTIVEAGFDTVGCFKTGDYEITLVLDKAITDFYLKYNLSSSWLVNQAKYEANMFTEGDLTKTKYCTDLATTMSCGPYKLTTYQIDKEFILEKNDKWYGYTDGKHEGQYQTTVYNMQIVEEQATALQLFLQGKLDTVSLTAEDMETYRASDFILFTPESYTSKFSMNGDLEALKARETDGINKSILSYTEFRKGIALSLDRSEFCAQCTATHSAGYGLLNYMYVYEPETGALYRESDIAKAGLCEFYGAESEDQITGYDLVQAKALITSAYEKCLADGNIKDTDKVSLDFHVYKSDDSYVKIVNFVDTALKAATVGTPLEGRVEVKMVANEDYYDSCQAGECDMIISTWGGASMDPWSMMECYCVNSMHFEYGFDATVETLEITVDGKAITKTYNEWYEALCNGEYAAAPNTTKLQILSGLEKGLLDLCYTTPMYYRTAASLDSRQIKNATDEYVQIVAFGGIRELTYNYNDEQWAAYCAENNNKLTY